MKKLKKVFKIVFVAVFIIFIILYSGFIVFTNPKSDAEILKSYKESNIVPVISHDRFKGFDYRKIVIQKDTSLPTIVFIHGTVGSIDNYSKYLADSTLQQKANMLSYDRVGYNYKDENLVQESVAFEHEMLQDVVKNIPLDKIILVGYSYGGPIALAMKQKIRKIILLAPAVYSEVEPMPSIVNLYKWKPTRMLASRVWQQAAKEKMSHPTDLKNFENAWKLTPNKVVSIHGTKDWIAPLGNSEFLEKEFPKEQFSLVKIEGAGHELVWSHFGFIKQELLNNLD